MVDGLSEYPGGSLNRNEKSGYITNEPTTRHVVDWTCGKLCNANHMPLKEESCTYF